MSALRDVIARMAVDSEFARHARANPDQVAREHGLTAEEAAKLRGLADAGSGGGPMALGARLSKSGFGTGGLAAAAAEALEGLEELQDESQPGPPNDEEVPPLDLGGRLGGIPGAENTGIHIAGTEQPSLQLDSPNFEDALQQPPGDPFHTGEGDGPPSGPADEQPSLQDLLNQKQDPGPNLPDLSEGSEDGVPDPGDSLKLPGGFQLGIPEASPGGDPGPEQPGDELPEIDYTFPELETMPDGPAPEGGAAEAPPDPVTEQAPPGGGPATEQATPGGGPADVPPAPATDQPAPAYQPAPMASGPLADQPAAPLGAPGGPAGPTAPGPTAPGPAPAGISGVSGQAQSLLPSDPSAPQPQPAAASGIGAAGIAMGAAGAAAGGVAGGIGGAVAGRAAGKASGKGAGGGTPPGDSATPDADQAD